MKNKILIILFIIFLSSIVHANSITLTNARVDIYFSPKGGCADAIIEAIEHAKAEILVQSYSFTSKPIAQALVNANKRGILTRVILDRSNRSAKYSAADFTAHMGISTYIDAAHAIAHNKIMIIDRETIITGSFNFTKAAEERNAENLLIIRSKELANAYIENWTKHREHSSEYRGKE